MIRFKPDGSAVEQVASGSCNTWGFDFAPDGEMFYTTATCGEHLLHIVMPEKALARGNIGGGLRASAVIPDHQKVFPLVHHTRPLTYKSIGWECLPRPPVRAFMMGVRGRKNGTTCISARADSESRSTTIPRIRTDDLYCEKETGHEETEFFGVPISGSVPSIHAWALMEPLCCGLV